MLKTLAMVMAFGLVGCGGGGGDKCERVYDKMAPVLKKLAKGEERDAKKDEKAERAKGIADCRAELKKKPEVGKQLDCILAIKGELTTDALVTCFQDGDDAETGKESAKKGATTAEMMAKFVEFKDQMCACKDKACAEKVTAAMAASPEQQELPMAKMTEDELKKADEIATQLTDCETKVKAATP